MEVQYLKLLNFRNYESLNLSFSNKKNIIYGLNGSGKTNIVEAIYMLSLTKTFRSPKDEVVIQKGKNIAKIEAKIKDKYSNIYKIMLNPSGKRIKVDNNKIARISDYIGKINVILFNPDDLKIIKDTPSTRRKLLNMEISGMNSEYVIYLNDYNKILKQRNAYLKACKKKSLFNEEFFAILTGQLIDIGLKIMLVREEFINNINLYISTIYEKITHKGILKLQYKSEYKNKSKEQLLELYKKNLSREIAMEKTLYGPQHDDIEFLIDKEIVKEFSSVGEQKNSVISYKLAELQLLKEKYNKQPILILDDLFSEIDEEKINHILELIDEDVQTFITTTNIDQLGKNILSKSKIFHVVNGEIREEKDYEQRK